MAAAGEKVPLLQPAQVVRPVEPEKVPAPQASQAELPGSDE